LSNSSALVIQTELKRFEEHTFLVVEVVARVDLGVVVRDCVVHICNILHEEGTHESITLRTFHLQKAKCTCISIELEYFKENL
jgi:hypothetical protein